MNIKNPPKQRQIEEIIKCGKDPTYFLNQYVKIQHPLKGVIPFDTYQFQDDCLVDFIKYRFNVILKSRQLGISTLVAAYAVWLAMYHKDQSILIIATKSRVAMNMIRKVKVAINNIPRWLWITNVKHSTKQEVEFSNGSTIKAIPTSEDAGRSEALSLLIVDEAAFVRNFDEIWTALYPTLSTGGRAIVLSTPNGVGNQYHKLFVDADAGINKFNAIRLPWTVHPEHTAAWFEEQKNNLGTERKVAQELLCDFLASGDTFMNHTDIDWIRELIKPPIYKTYDDNNVWVWKSSLTQHPYVISADVARGDSKDFSTFHIIDLEEGEVVVEYKGKIRPDVFAELLVDYGKKYNNALLCPENNNYGYAVCQKIRELNYPKLYYKNVRNVFVESYIAPGDASQAGLTTSGITRPRILAKLEEVIRNRTLRIYSSRFFEELKTFVYLGDKPQAQKGHNDDLVLSLAIGSFLYDAAGGYNASSRTYNDAMLLGMGKSERKYKGPDVKNPSNKSDWDPFAPIQTTNNTAGLSGRQMRQLKMLKDVNWLIN